MVAVVQQRQVRAGLIARGLEHSGDVAQFGAGVPVLLGGRRRALGGFVIGCASGACGVASDGQDGITNEERDRR